LNNATIRKATVLGSPIEVFAHAAQKAYISTIDISNAFFQIPIKYEHQCYTAFYCDAHSKRYCFTRVPQGLKNSPLFLKLLMDKMFASSDLLKHVIYYADDIMIATNKSLSHIEIIDKVLECFEKANIKIRAQKMSIAKPEVEFLGIVWRKGMLHIPTARILAFKNMPVPKTPKKVKSFVCAMSYYRRFIPKFAELAKPFMDLSTLHPSQFKWQEIHQKAFVSMIDAIQTHFFEFTRPIKTIFCPN
jgi:Reverse transcriptase (RNA-dependent DNA polymerase)